jgi:hypothetical protein
MQCTKIKQRSLTLVRLWQAFLPVFSIQDCFKYLILFDPTNTFQDYLSNMLPHPPRPSLVAIFLIVTQTSKGITDSRQSEYGDWERAATRQELRKNVVRRNKKRILTNNLRLTHVEQKWQIPRKSIRTYTRSNHLLFTVPPLPPSLENFHSDLTRESSRIRSRKCFIRKSTKELQVC